MKVALFGTSADPPTTAHLEILRWLSEQFDHVAVWAADNPFKSHQTPLEHRTAMLQLLVNEVECPRVQVHSELSYPRTLMTVEQAKHRWPSADFTLVVGFDAAQQLPKWFRIAELLQQVNVLVVPRSGYHFQTDVLDRIQQFGTDVTIAPIAVPEVSSTAYREHRDLRGVTQSIQAYIDREQLYRCHAHKEEQPVH
jgi:nicotinate-nucleotide adenylyltransferase